VVSLKNCYAGFSSSSSGYLCCATRRKFHLFRVKERGPYSTGPVRYTRISLDSRASEMLQTSYEEEHKIAAVDRIAVPALSEKFRNISSDTFTTKC
jgi:hypothetical protein